MGLKVQQFLSKKFKTNDEYIKKYQNFTKSIDDAYTRAFQQTIEFVMSSFNNWASKVYGSRMKDEQFVNRDRKSTRLNSSHVAISYAVFCLKKKKIRRSRRKRLRTQA